MRSRVARAGFLIAFLTSGCGGPGGEEVDAPPDEDARPPDAAVPSSLGEVGGETISPVISWWSTDGYGNYVVLREGGARCQAAGGIGQGVGLFFRCGNGEPGTYPVRSGGVDCSNGPFVIVSVSNTAYGSQWAQSGSAELTAVSPTMQGTFSAGQFYNGDYPSIPGSLSGPFEASGCP